GCKTQARRLRGGGRHSTSAPYAPRLSQSTRANWSCSTSRRVNTKWMKTITQLSIVPKHGLYRRRRSHCATATRPPICWPGRYQCYSHDDGQHHSGQGSGAVYDCTRATRTRGARRGDHRHWLQRLYGLASSVGRYLGSAVPYAYHGDPR